MVPAKVEGAWQVTPGGALTIAQKFQNFDGTLGSAKVSDGRAPGLRIGLQQLRDGVRGYGRREERLRNRVVQLTRKTLAFHRGAGLATHPHESELSVHAGQELRCSEWLYEIGVCTRAQRVDSGLVAGASRHENDRCGPELDVVSDRPEQLHAVERGHHDIGKDEVRLPGTCQLQGRNPVGRRLHLADMNLFQFGRIGREHDQPLLSLGDPGRSRGDGLLFLLRTTGEQEHGNQQRCGSHRRAFPEIESIV